MPKSAPEDYQSFSEYSRALEAFQAVTGILLFEFAQHAEGYRETIIRDFIARTHVLAGAVFKLWELRDYQDCWILYRSLLDRLFHLHDLNKRDQFELFEAWSFLAQYHAINRVKSDPEFKSAAGAFPVTPKDKERVNSLLKSPPRWNRPKPEAVAKDLGMGFLYRFGYDFASTHVHPMANDGHEDFYRITGLEPAPQFPDQRVVLVDTLLVATMVVQEGLNASALHWREVVYVFLEDLRRFLGEGSPEFERSFAGVWQMVKQKMPLCDQKAAG